MNVDKWEMNENIYISQITDQLREVPGVINVVDIRFYNMESGGYSDTVHFQATADRLLLSTGGFRTQIQYIDNTILGTPLSMFEIKYPDRDIACRVA
jgi:Co/Zn/Cd efflux system component